MRGAAVMTRDRDDVMATPDGYLVATPANSAELQAAREHAAELVARFRKGRGYRESEPEFGMMRPDRRASGADG